MARGESSAVKRTSRRAGAKSSSKRARRARTPGISRIDQERSRTHGFFVRVGYEKTRTGYRPRASAFFGDATHGGERGAMRAAEAWLAKAKRALARAGSSPKAGTRRSAKGKRTRAAA
jgi:hypothetical protein